MKRALSFIFLVFVFQGFGQNPDSLQRALKVSKTRLDSATLHNEIAKYHRSRDVGLALTHWSEANRLTLGSKDPKFELQYARSLNGIGIVNSNIRNDAVAAEYYHKAAEVYSRLGDTSRVSTIKFNLARVYSRAGHYEPGLTAALEALQIRKKYSGEKDIARVYELVGSLYRKLGNTKKADTYLDSLQWFSTSANYAYGLGLAYGSKGRIALNEKNYPLAISYFSKAVANYKQDNNVSATSLLLARLGNAYYQNGNYKEARINAQEALETAQVGGFKNRILNPLMLLSLIAEKEGKTAEALKYAREHAKIKVTLDRQEHRQTIENSIAKASLKAKLKQDSLEYAQRRKSLKVKVKQQRTLKKLFLLIGILLTVILSIVAIYLRQRYLRSKSSLETEQKSGQELKQSLDSREKDIQTLATEISLRGDLRNQVLARLKEILNQPEKQVVKSLNKYLLSLMADQSEESRLAPLREKVDEIHHEFFDKLSRKLPELTPTEKEICAFIRAGLGNKEIAQIRNTSISAIKTSKFRIRRKLNIDSDKELILLIKDV